MNNSLIHQAQLNDWAIKIQEQKASGLRVDDWCSLNNTTRHQFYYWRSLLKTSYIEESSPEIVPLQLPTTVSDSCSNNLTTLSSPLPTIPTASGSVKISVGNVAIEVTSETPSDLLIKVLKAVKNA